MLFYWWSINDYFYSIAWLFILFFSLFNYQIYDSRCLYLYTTFCHNTYSSIIIPVTTERLFFAFFYNMFDVSRLIYCMLFLQLILNQ